MGNEVSRPTGTGDVSPQNSGVVPPTTPSTPTGGFSRRSQSFNARAPSPSPTSSNGNLTGNPGTNPKKERSIQRMDKAIRRRVRGGITYNMKLLLRGAKGTGKTSLFHRLKGEPIPDTHESTPQLQSATINWSFRQLEENVKCEVWDVVDRGFVPVAAEGDGGQASGAASGGSLPVENGGLQRGGNISAEASAAAIEAAAAMHNGTHAVAVVDASTVDVYHEAHGVIFLLDVTKWDTLEYVKQQLDTVPVHIPTLVLGNFRDQGAQRKIFKEDIQKLLYGSSGRPQHQQWRRPMELLYFECSLLNCYGLKSLHQYFGIPFLQLKLATIRQQMRIVEGEFAHLKHDVQATIREQRYADYVNHIRATGSDIRTGRRGSGASNTPPSSSRNGSMEVPNRENWNQDGASNDEATDDDVSVISKENRAEVPPEMSVSVSAKATDPSEAKQQEQEAKQPLDTGDLPARSSSAVIMAAAPLLFEHKESAASLSTDVAEERAAESDGKLSVSVDRISKAPAATNVSSGRPRKASVEEVIHLEDFQVPKARISELDQFYSDESDDDVGEHDEDVVVAPVDGAMKTTLSGVFHKQRFLDSDSSDSDGSEILGTQRERREKGSRKISPRRAATKHGVNASQQAPKAPMPSPHLPASSSRLNQGRSPGSPVRQQPRSSIKEASSQQMHSIISSGNRGSVSPGPPPAPPTSPVNFSFRHVSLRGKGNISTAVPQPEASPSLSRVEVEVFSTRETELTDTEDVVGRDKEEEYADGSVTEESPKNSDSSSTDRVDDMTPQGGNAQEMDGDASDPIETMKSDMPTQRNSALEVLSNDSDENVDNDQDEVVRVPTYDQDNDYAEDEGSVSPITGGDISNSDELKTSRADESIVYGGEGHDTPVQNETSAAHISSVANRHPEVLMRDEEIDEGTKAGAAGFSVVSLQASIPIPETSSSNGAVSPRLAGTQSSTESLEGMGHFHKRNMEEPSDLFLLSALQASLPISGQAVGPLPAMPQSTGFEGCDIKTETSALQLSDLQAPVKTPAVAVSDFTTVVPTNDLDAFLNESDSDSEDGPPSYGGSVGGTKQQSLNNRRTLVESSEDDDDEEDQKRFSNYSLNKKSRSERKRQQKEDLRQLNAAFDTGANDNERFVSSSAGVAVAESSFGTSDVMEAIRKAQEEAMRMIPSAPVADDVDADSGSTTRRHKHKLKKEQKLKKREVEEGKEKPSKKSNRKSSSGTRSKKRRPHVEEDLA